MPRDTEIGSDIATFIADIRDSVKVRADHSRIGRPVADMAKVFCDWVIDFGDTGDVVRYPIENDNIMTLAVRHLKGAGF